MKILRLNAENVKRLKAVEIMPTGELVEITGRNGQGKTSVLDAIWWALAGAKHIQAVPIRKGADRARIRLDLGEIVVERKFTATGSTLTVENAQGARFTSPQGMLDALLGALTFDPLAFLGQEPREQLAALRRIVPLEVDVDQLDGLNRGDFDRRTEVNRQAKAARAQAEAITVPADLPDELLDTQALMDRLTEASNVNADIERRRVRREAAVEEAAANHRYAVEARARAAELRQQALKLEADAAELDTKAEDLEQRLAAAEPLPALVDPAAIRAELEVAETTNRLIVRRTERQAHNRAAEGAEARARELTEAMAAREQAKADAIARAPMPVPGLSFGDGVVTFNGVPFDQASTAEQLRVSVAIAMAANPKLRVIRIKEGSLLDQDNLALIAAMAREHDYQVWIERVDTSGKVGVVIEDGSVVAVDGQPVETAAP